MVINQLVCGIECLLRPPPSSSGYSVPDDEPSEPASNADLQCHLVNSVDNPPSEINVPTYPCHSTNC